MKALYKILGLGLFLLILQQSTNAQQLPLHTQYMFNNFIVNPAIAGTYNYYQIRSNTRVQWVGIADHPITNYLSVYGPAKENDMGFGGYIFNDVTGPTSKTGLSGAYAYNLAITEEIRVSMGLALGLMQFKVDGSNINFKDQNDKLQGTQYSTWEPDATLGVYLYSYNYHVGFSTTQLLNNKLDKSFFDSTDAVSRLKSHFFLSGGYKYFIDKTWALEPTAMLKMVGAAPVQFDITVKGIYDNMVWGALAYRTGDNALSLLLGYIHEKQYYFGYSYDYSFSSIMAYTSGTHEITIGYRFNDIK